MKINESVFELTPRYQLFMEEKDRPPKFIATYHDLREAKSMAKINVRDSKKDIMGIIKATKESYYYITKQAEVNHAPVSGDAEQVDGDIC